MSAFRALADPIRRDMILRLAVAPTRVVDLAASFDISRPAISRHLRVLGEAGLVHAADVGRERHYALSPDPFAEIRSFVTEVDDRRRRGAGRPVVTHRHLDALDTEVRRTTRERRSTQTAETAGTAGTTETVEPPRPHDDGRPSARRKDSA